MLWNAANTVVTTFSHCVFLRSYNPVSCGRSETPKTKICHFSTSSFPELHPCFPNTVKNIEIRVITAAKLEGNNMISPRRNTTLFHFPMLLGVTTPLSRGRSETPETWSSPRSATVFFTELQPCFPNTVKNIEIRVITAAKLEGNNMISPRRNTKLFYFPIVIRSYNLCFPRTVWNAENTVVTTFSHCVFLRSYNPISHGRSETPETRLSQRLATVFFTELQPCFLRTVWNTGNTIVTTFQPPSFTELQPYFPRTVWNTENTVVTTFSHCVFSGVTPLFLVDGLKHRKRSYNHRETFTFRG